MVRPRILVVSNQPPWPATHGAAQRTRHLMRALAMCGDVDLLLTRCLRSGEQGRDQSRILRRDFGLVAVIELERRPMAWPCRGIMPLMPRVAGVLDDAFCRVRRDHIEDPKIAPVLAQLTDATRYDLIVGRYLSPTVRSGALNHPPVVVDIDDVDTAVHISRLGQPGLSRTRRWVMRRQLRQLRRIVPHLVAAFDHAWLAKDQDRALVSSQNVSVLPNIPVMPDRPVAPAPPDCPCVLIVSSLHSRPHLAGISHFVSRVWPRVRKMRRQAVLRIVGEGMRPVERQAWSEVDGVEPIGFVEDLIPAYEQSAFTIAPIYWGGGTKIKVLESLAYGRTCVATSHAYEGYADHFRHKDTIWLAQDDDAMADGCLELLNNPALRDAMAQRGNKLVREEFSIDRFQQIVERTVSEILSDRGASGDLSAPT